MQTSSRSNCVRPCTRSFSLTLQPSTSPYHYSASVRRVQASCVEVSRVSPRIMYWYTTPRSTACFAVTVVHLPPKARESPPEALKSLTVPEITEVGILHHGDIRLSPQSLSQRAVRMTAASTTEEAFRGLFAFMLFCHLQWICSVLATLTSSICAHYPSRPFKLRHESTHVCFAPSSRHPPPPS
jgi:hypothetical protein